MSSAKQTYNWVLSHQDTAVLKGIAIIAMLMHHLWGCSPSWVEPYTGVLGFLGDVGKVCVAIFLFCSGYGLSVGYSKIVDNAQCTMQSWKYRFVATLKFLAKRFVKFYAGYWPIFLIFVPVGVLLFERSLSVAYGDPHISWYLLKDIAGIGCWQSYNITWWFNTLIIILYLLFPLLYWLSGRLRWGVLILSILMARMVNHLPQIFDTASLCTYQLPFLLGILWYQHEKKLQRLESWVNNHKWMFCISAIVLFCITILLRVYPIIPHWSGWRMDGFITIGLVLIIVAFRSYLKHLFQSLVFFGKHSMNIYMTHTFFFSYWFAGFFYSCELGGGMNIMALLTICILTSLIIEWLKQKTKWNNISAKLIEKIDKL